jgi:hypothetical protein
LFQRHGLAVCARAQGARPRRLSTQLATLRVPTARRARTGGGRNKLRIRVF